EEPPLMPIEQQAQFLHLAVLHGHHQVFVGLNHLASKNSAPAKRLHNETKTTKGEGVSHELNEFNEFNPLNSFNSWLIPSRFWQRTGFGRPGGKVSTVWPR